MIVMYNGQFNYLNQKYSKQSDLKYIELKSGVFSQPSYGIIQSTQYLDLYNAYEDILPLENKVNELLKYSLSTENMRAKFTNKQNDIELLIKKYPNQDLAFFLLDKEESKFYVLYSKTQNAIVEYLKF
jgi:hypothetical protein